MSRGVREFTRLARLALSQAKGASSTTAASAPSSAAAAATPATQRAAGAGPGTGSANREALRRDGEPKREAPTGEAAPPFLGHTLAGPLSRTRFSPLDLAKRRLPAGARTFASSALAEEEPRTKATGDGASVHKAETEGPTPEPTWMNEEQKSALIQKLSPSTLEHLQFRDQELKLLGSSDGATTRLTSTNRALLEDAQAKLERAQAGVAAAFPEAKLEILPHPDAPGLGLRIAVRTAENERALLDSTTLAMTRAHHPDAVFTHTINKGGARTILQSLHIRNNENNKYGAGAYFHNGTLTPSGSGVTIVNAKMTEASRSNMVTKGAGQHVAFAGDGAHMISADFVFPAEDDGRGKFIGAVRDTNQPGTAYTLGNLGRDGLPDHATAKPLASLDDVRSWLDKYE